MNKRRDVFNSPEYRHIEDHLDEIMEELEGDENTRDITMPEAWDKDFREVLEKVKVENRQRRRKKLRRTIVAAAAVVIVLLPVIGFFGRETVEGDGIMELIEKNIFMEGRRYGMAGTDGDNLTIDPQAISEVVVSASDIQELNKKIDREVAHEFYRINWIPKDFSFNEAVYNQEYNTLNIELYNGDNYIYVSQQFIVTTGLKNNVSENEKIDIVKNDNLGIPINIYNSLTDKCLSFSFILHNVKLDCYMETGLEDCKKIAENIDYY